MEMTTAIRERITQKIRMSLKDYQAVYLEAFVEAYWVGFQEGFRQGVRDSLLCQMEERFGPLPYTLRHQIESIRDPEELKKIGRRLFTVSSLDDLGL